jgi:hypothetical protein
MVRNANVFAKPIWIVSKPKAGPHLLGSNTKKEERFVMSKVAVLRETLPVHDKQQRYLGPATVVSLREDRVEVQLEDDVSVLARWALGYTYHPCVDDVLLVIGQEDAFYVIGILQGNGQSDLQFAGDVHLHARQGELTLSGDKGVRVEGPKFDVITEKFQVVAEQAMHKVSVWYQRVSGLMNVRAKESTTIVEERSVHKAKASNFVTEETISINGKQVQLG